MDKPVKKQSVRPIRYVTDLGRAMTNKEKQKRFQDKRRAMLAEYAALLKASKEKEED